MEDKEILQLDENIQQSDEKMEELGRKMKELREEREKLLELKRKFELDHKPFAEQKYAELKVLENLNLEETSFSSINKEAGKEEEKKKKKKKKNRNKKKKEPSIKAESDCMVAVGSRDGDSNEVESNLREKEKEETSIKETEKVVQEAFTNLNLDNLGVDEPILKFVVGSGGSGCTFNKRRTKKNHVKPRMAHTRDKNIRLSDDASAFVGTEVTRDSNEVMENDLKTGLTQILKIGLAKMLAVNSNGHGDGKITTGVKAYQEKRKKKK